MYLLFKRLKTIAALVNYTCNGFIELTPGLASLTGFRTTRPGLKTPVSRFATPVHPNLDFLVSKPKSCHQSLKTPVKEHRAKSKVSSLQRVLHVEILGVTCPSLRHLWKPDCVTAVNITRVLKHDTNRKRTVVCSIRHDYVLCTLIRLVF